MSKNGWYACIIVVIVVSCACVFCLMVSLIGIAGYRSYLPDSQFELSRLSGGCWFTNLLPHRHSSLSPEVSSTPHLTFDPATPQIEVATPVPESTSCSRAWCADRYHSHPGKYIYSDQ